MFGLKDLGVQKCGSAHCTGESAIKIFKEYVKDDFIDMGAGLKINI